MKKSFATLLIITAIGLGIIQISYSLPYTTTVNIPGGVFDLEFQLWDWDWSLNSYALIDNIYTKDAVGNIIEVVDFEDGTLQGFNESLNPDAVDVVSGGLPYTTGSNWMMQMDEDPVAWPTVTWRSFLPSAGTLTFSFEFNAANEDDEFQVYLKDINGDPLIDGILGSWDPVILSQWGSASPQMAQGVTTSPIPEPTSMCLIGFGILGLLGFGIRQRRKQK